MTAVERPALAHWMWERGFKPRHAEQFLKVSKQSIRRYCMPFGNAERRIPSEDVMGRIVAWTNGAVTPADFYPPAFRPSGDIDVHVRAREDVQ